MSNCSRNAALELNFSPFCQCAACLELGKKAVKEAQAARKKALSVIYREKPKDYKGRLADGQRAVLVLRGGTVLAPLDSLTDAEIIRMLEPSLKLAARRAGA